MASSLSDIEMSRRLSGVVADGDLTVAHLTATATLDEPEPRGTPDERTLTVDGSERINQVSDRRRTFDDDRCPVSGLS